MRTIVFDAVPISRFLTISATCMVVMSSSVMGADRQGVVGAVTKTEVELVPFRAVYDLGLGEGTSSSALSAISGRLVYELKGSDCDGYAVTQRLVSRTELAEGQLVYEDVQSASFEDLRSRSFRFVTRSRVDDEVSLTAKGYAQHVAGAVDLMLSEPDSRTKSLPEEVLFPVEYLKMVIARTLNGERFYNALLFDGSEEGDQLFQTTISAGDVQLNISADGQPFGLQGLRHWPVTVTYFDAESDGVSMEPVYSLTTHLYENGVTTSLEMRYQGFSMEGQLVDLTLLERSVCPDGR